MLKKTNRISKTREMNRVYRHGKTVHTSALVIKFLADKKIRLGFVVSKKVSKKAVTRNRIKRVLREQLRLNMAKLQIGDYMVMVKSQAEQMPAPQLRKELQHALDKANLWQK